MATSARFHGVAVVTGAAQGIGRALAEALAQEGARLVLADLDAAPPRVEPQMLLFREDFPCR